MHTQIHIPFAFSFSLRISLYSRGYSRSTPSFHSFLFSSSIHVILEVDIVLFPLFSFQFRRPAQANVSQKPFSASFSRAVCTARRQDYINDWIHRPLGLFSLSLSLLSLTLTYSTLNTRLFETWNFCYFPSPSSPPFPCTCVIIRQGIDPLYQKRSLPLLFRIN